MLFNSRHQIGRSAVVQEKNAFPETPERCRAELVAFCLALRDAVIEFCTHVVKRKIRKEIYIFVAQLRDHGFFAREFDCVKRRGMAKGAPYLTEKASFVECLDLWTTEPCDELKVPSRFVLELSSARSPA